VRISELSARHFELHPMWSEYYDFDERHEIISWGVDRKWLEAALERVHDGSDHCAYPILRPYPLPARMRLYMKARITTAGGARLDGYIMNEDAFVVTLFAGENEFSFSRHSGLNAQPIEGLRHALAAPGDPVLPLRYETDFLGQDDRLIQGEFSAVTDDN
jgi:hypothetical protein